MRGRLITNGILSLISSIILIVWIALLVHAIHAAQNETVVTNSYYGSYYNSYNVSSTSNVNGILAAGAAVMVFAFLGGIASLVMGIVTLSMQKHPNARGLTIASGVLAILGGAFCAGAIVSFIGAAKAKD